jgi:hypothetical protein
MDKAGEQPRNDVSFPPIPNGIDYLVNVVELLSRDKGGPSPRDMKYSVLHLQAAV